MNDGLYYHQVCSCTNGDTYWYRFPRTEAASTVKQKLNLATVIKKPVNNFDDILPECSIHFSDYKIPCKFIGKPDALLVVGVARQQGHQQGLQELMDIIGQIVAPGTMKNITEVANSTTPGTMDNTMDEMTDSDTDSDRQLLSTVLEVKGQEPNRNDYLVGWLKENLGQDFEVIADTQSKGNLTYRDNKCYISRFGRSRQDFGFKACVRR